MATHCTLHGYLLHTARLTAYHTPHCTLQASSVVRLVPLAVSVQHLARIYRDREDGHQHSTEDLIQLYIAYSYAGNDKFRKLLLQVNRIRVRLMELMLLTQQ